VVEEQRFFRPERRERMLADAALPTIRHEEVPVQPRSGISSVRAAADRFAAEHAAFAAPVAASAPAAPVPAAVPAPVATPVVSVAPPMPPAPATAAPVAPPAPTFSVTAFAVPAPAPEPIRTPVQEAVEPVVATPLTVTSEADEPDFRVSVVPAAMAETHRWAPAVFAAAPQVGEAPEVETAPVTVPVAVTVAVPAAPPVVAQVAAPVAAPVVAPVAAQAPIEAVVASSLTTSAAEVAPQPRAVASPVAPEPDLRAVSASIFDDEFFRAPVPAPAPTRQEERPEPSKSSSFFLNTPAFRTYTPPSPRQSDYETGGGYERPAPPPPPRPVEQIVERHIEPEMEAPVAAEQPRREAPARSSFFFGRKAAPVETLETADSDELDIPAFLRRGR
jgi:hypothetical protein